MGFGNGAGGTQNIEFIRVKKWKIPWAVITKICSLTFVGSLCAPLVHSRTRHSAVGQLSPRVGHLCVAADVSLPTSTPYPTWSRGCELRHSSLGSITRSFTEKFLFWAFAP